MQKIKFAGIFLLISLANGQAPCGFNGHESEAIIPLNPVTETFPGGLIAEFETFNISTILILPAFSYLSNYLSFNYSSSENTYQITAKSNFPQFLETIRETSIQFGLNIFCSGSSQRPTIALVLNVVDENNQAPVVTPASFNLNAFEPFNPSIPLNFDPLTGFTSIRVIDCDIDLDNANPQFRYIDQDLFHAVAGTPRSGPGNCHLFDINIYLLRKLPMGFYRTGIYISDGVLEHEIMIEMILRIEPYPYENHICTASFGNTSEIENIEDVCRIENESSAIIFDEIPESSINAVIGDFTGYHLQNFVISANPIPNLNRYLQILLSTDAEDPTKDKLTFTTTENWIYLVEETRLLAIDLILDFNCDDNTMFYIHFQIPITEENTNAPIISRALGDLNSYLPFNEFYPINFAPDIQEGFKELQITDCDFLVKNTDFTLSSTPDLLRFASFPEPTLNDANCHVFNVQMYLKAHMPEGTTPITVHLNDEKHPEWTESINLNIIPYPIVDDGVCQTQL